MQFSSVYDFKIAVSPVCCVSCSSGLQAHALHAQCIVYGVSRLADQSHACTCTPRRDRRDRLHDQQSQEEDQSEPGNEVVLAEST